MNLSVYLIRIDKNLKLITKIKDQKKFKKFDQKLFNKLRAKTDAKYFFKKFFFSP